MRHSLVNKVIAWAGMGSILMNPVKSYSLNSEVGLIWVQSRIKLTPADKKKWERSLIDDIENNVGRKVIRSFLNLEISEEIVRNLKKVSELSKQSSYLWHLTQSPARGPREAVLREGERIIGIQSRILSSLNRGVFGPEMQESKLAQASWNLFVGRKEKAIQLIREASEIHPQGKLMWNKDSSTAFGHVFEALILENSDASSEFDCLLEEKKKKDGAGSQLWINGFKMGKDFNGVRIGRYLMNTIPSNQSGVFEELLVCQGKEIRWDEFRWSYMGIGGRIEQWFFPEQRNIEELLLLMPQKTGIKKMAYTKKGGVTPVLERRAEWGAPLKLEIGPRPSEAVFDQKKEDSTRDSRLSLKWLVGSLALAIGLAYGLRSKDEPASIPVIFRRE